MIDQYLDEQLQILRRTTETGLKEAQDNCEPMIDIFQHLLDEIERTQLYLKGKDILGD